ncbi:AraC family transcriptional regulator [Photobacterium salinisoli]|uniref:AraC family transcriptional regulator n=1 Tax=Photobacterium salinisoli TaxID=1616783 RepID=UPI000EA3CA25|nr:AraC family transcriptional regulator [Photobacterium salinisoli]
MKDLYVRAVNIARFDAFALAHKVKVGPLIREAGLPSDVFTHPEHLILFRRFTRLMTLAQLRFNIPLVGLKFGLYQGTAAIGPLFHLISNAQNVEQALHELINNFYLHSEGAEIRLVETDDLVVLCYNPSLEIDDDVAPITEVAIGVGLRLLQLFFGKQWKPKHIFFQHLPLASVTEYDAVLQQTPDFNSLYNGLGFERQWLKQPLVNADPSLHRLVKQHIQRLEDVTLDKIPEQVRRVLYGLLPNGKGSLTDVAQFMMLSSRTLQRYLKDEGTSFKIILEETRKKMATRYLRESNMSLTQLAEVLGYADNVAFSRAFCAWFGLTPRQWQKQEGIKKRTGLKRRVR